MTIVTEKNTQNNNIGISLSGLHIVDGEILEYDEARASQLDPRVRGLIAAIKENFGGTGAVEISFSIEIKETPT